MSGGVRSIFTLFGYFVGIHAPGRRDRDAFLRASHVVNLAQGEAFRAMRAVRADAVIGTAFSMTACQPARDTEQDQAAAERHPGVPIEQAIDCNDDERNQNHDQQCGHDLFHPLISAEDSRAHGNCRKNDRHKGESDSSIRSGGLDHTAAAIGDRYQCRKSFP